MRTLTANLFLTLDGVYQGPGGPTEDPSDGFTAGGWSVNYWDEVMGERQGEWMNPQADLLLGRKTYEIFASYWPDVSEDSDNAPTAAILNRATKYVASTTLDKAEWDNSHVLDGDAVEAVTKLKEQDGPEIQVHGSGNLLQTLLRHGLVDELQLMVFPVVVGRGKRLFADGTAPAALRVVKSVVSSTGVVVATYVPAGEIEFGSF
jgi:dihydrofolate reductase